MLDRVGEDMGPASAGPRVTPLKGVKRCCETRCSVNNFKAIIDLEITEIEDIAFTRRYYVIYTLGVGEY